MRAEFKTIEVLICHTCESRYKRVEPGKRDRKGGVDGQASKEFDKVLSENIECSSKTSKTF